MTIVALALDATGGVPAYTAQGFRQALSGLLFNGTSRPLGGQSGIVPGNASTVTANSTTWSVTPGSFVVDAAFTTTQAPYLISNDTTVTGTVTAAGSVARVDAVDLRVDDDPVDGSGSRRAVFVYTAGNATTGVVATLAARSIRVATINVPASGGGSPTVSMSQQYAVATGGILPLANAAARDALITKPYDGMPGYLRTEDLFQIYTPTGWATVGTTQSGLLWTNTRPGTSDNFNSGSPFTPLFQVNLPSTAPAGTYSMSTVFTLGTTVTTSGNLRIFDPAGNNLSADMTFNPIVAGNRTPINYVASFPWTGGVGSVQVLFEAASGTTTINNAGARLDVAFIRP